jgi:hypothetical protein
MPLALDVLAFAEGCSPLSRAAEASRVGGKGGNADRQHDSPARIGENLWLVVMRNANKKMKHKMC